MELTDKQKDEVRLAVSEIKRHLRVTKVVCTRSVKGRNGDTYVGFSAAWDTVQDDAGGGIDLIADEGMSKGLTLKESKLAALILAMQVDLAAHNHAAAGGNLSEVELQKVRNGIQIGYHQLIAEAMFGNGDGNG
jgi:hypothetical protein